MVVSWYDLRIILTLKYGKPIGGGRTRLVFKTKTGVVKLEYPKSIGSNVKEYNIKEQLIGVPMPKMRLMRIMGQELLFMEWVEKVPWTKDLPYWVGVFDCGQVGYTKDGRLVPFDII